MRAFLVKRESYLEYQWRLFLEQCKEANEISVSNLHDDIKQLLFDVDEDAYVSKA